MQSELELRALILAPTARDGAVTQRLLSEIMVEATVCSSVRALVNEHTRGAGVMIVTDDFMRTEHSADAILQSVRSQAEWSEIPVICLTRGPADPTLNRLRDIPGIVFVERPVQARTFLSAVQAALRARRRQYQIRDQLAQIQAKNKELEVSAHAKDEFLATLSHELRNPLSALSMASQLLTRSKGDPMQTELATNAIKRQIKQVGRLLDDLLDISRITRGRFELRKERSDLAQIVRTSIEAVQPSVTAKRHRLVFNAPAEQIMLDSDPVRLAQVVSNVLMNASKYTDIGGRIDVEIVRDEGSAVIRVKDTGIGIPADSLTAIFDMFSQLRPALERSEGGLGIGLALAKGIVDLHGGSIRAHSEGVGCGSTFEIRLPVIVEERQPAHPETQASSRVKPRKILVADDNPDGLKSLVLLLSLDGHTVYEACDGLAAWQIAQSHKIDAALLDIGMPGLNGYEVAQRIRQMESDELPTLIALTGWGQASDKQRAQSAGFDHHITKPVDIGEINDVLANR